MIGRSRLLRVWAGFLPGVPDRGPGRSSRRPWAGSGLALGLVLAACGGGSEKPRDATVIDTAVIDTPVADDAQDAAGDGPSRDGPRDGSGGFVCDPIHQTGCSPGEKCDIAPSGTFGCLVVRSNPLDDFRRCDAKDQPNDCKAGFTCSGTFSAANRCTRICSQLENQCLRGERCETSHQTSDGKQYLTCATHQACNPILDDCAEPNTHCSYLAAAAISVCVTTGTVADGAVCQVHADSTQDCLPASACVNTAGTVFRCVRMCDPAGGEPSCAAGGTCGPFTTVGPQAVGLCPVP